VVWSHLTLETANITHGEVAGHYELFLAGRFK